MLRKSYLFHTYSLSMSGGSKSILSIAEGLSKRGHSVSILIERDIVKHKVPENVDVYVLNMTKITPANLTNKSFNDSGDKQKIINNRVKNFFIQYYWVQFFYVWFGYILTLPLFFLQNKIVKNFLKKNKTDIVVSNNMYRNLEHLFFYKNKVSRVYMSLRNSPKNVYKERVTPRIFPLSFYYSQVTCIGVSEATTLEMSEFVNPRETELITIYNPFEFSKILDLSKESLRGNECHEGFYIYVGNLTYRKRVDLTIKAFSECADKTSKLYIIGDGDKKRDLENLVAILDIKDRVRFLGEKSNPYKYIVKAKALILTSESEGLPRVLIESLICNTIAISTDCPTGPNEILTDGLSVFLVSIHNDERKIIKDIAKKIDLVNSVEVIIDRNNLNRFEFDNVIDEWQKL